MGLVSMPSCNGSSIRKVKVAVVMAPLSHPLALHRWFCFGCILEWVSWSHLKIHQPFSVLDPMPAALKCPAEPFK